jgi:hypothetical protein
MNYRLLYNIEKELKAAEKKLKKAGPQGQETRQLQQTQQTQQATPSAAPGQ